MRITNLLQNLLNLEGVRIKDKDAEFDDLGLVVSVQLKNRLPRCSGCSEPVRRVHDRRRGRRWRHLDLAGMQLHLSYGLRRARCPRCGVRVEQMPWAETGSWFTRAFEDQVGYLAQRCDKTTVSTLMRIAWATVGDIIQRVVTRHGRADPLEGLTHIGVDELSYRRHHEYVTTVVDHRSGAIVWAHPGKNADTLRAFFDELGPERCSALNTVTIDMSGAYIKALTEAVPQAELVFDRFHVQRLAHRALDEVRRAEVRQAPSADKKHLKRTR